MTLAGKTVLITGAARGIGAEVARQAAVKGARVVLVGLEPELLATVRDRLPGTGHLAFAADVTDQAQLDAAVAATGAIDVVVANAGIMPLGSVAATSVEALVRTIDVNLGGAVRTISATLPAVRAARGYYLLVASITALAATPGTAAYGATKAGIEQYGNALRAEAAAYGVGVGVAYPNRVDTDMSRDIYEEVPTIRAAMRRMGRPVTVADCAAAYLDAIERRRARVYVPGSVRWVRALRNLASGRVATWAMGKVSARASARVDDEVRGSFGGPFGRNSVERR